MHDRSLHFATYYKINFESFAFIDNGEFFRETSEDSPVPLPVQSNFCGGGSGVAKDGVKYEENICLNLISGGKKTIRIGIHLGKIELERISTLR